MCVLIFSTTFLWNISHFAKNQAVYYQKCTMVVVLNAVILVIV